MEVVLVTVKQNCLVLGYVLKELKGDMEMILVTEKQNDNVLKYTTTPINDGLISAGVSALIK